MDNCFLCICLRMIKKNRTFTDDADLIFIVSQCKLEENPLENFYLTVISTEASRNLESRKSTLP